MRALMWFLRLLLFVLLFGFAVKNDHLAELHFFFGVHWQLPLVFVILLSFIAGTLIGVSATLASLLRQRREIHRLRRKVGKQEREAAPAVPAADAQAQDAR